MLFCEPIPYLKSPIKCKTLVLLTLDWVSWKNELDKTWLVITRKQYAQNYCTILSIFKKSFRVEVSLWFLFCSGQVFFERTLGALLRPVQGTSLREDPWRPPASSSGDQSSRGPLAPSCVQFRGPVFERTPGALLRPVQGTSLREDPWRPPVSIQNFLFKMTSSPRALQIHPTRSYTDSDLFGYTLLKNK